MKRIACDFESHLISNERPIPPPVCLSTYEYGGIPKLYVGMDDMGTVIEQMLDNYERIIAHNAQFELKIIYKYWPHLRPKLWRSLDEGKWFCTKLYQQLINNVSKKQIMNKALDSLVKEYFKEDISEDKKSPDAWRLRYDELDGVPLKEWPQKAIDYALQDSIWALKLHDVQRKQERIDFEEQVIDEFVLNLMAAKGILIDQARVQQLERECWEAIIPPYRLLNKHGMVKLKNLFKANGEPYASPVEAFRRDKLELDYIIQEQDKILKDWVNNACKYKMGKSIKAIHQYIKKHFSTLIFTEKNEISTTSESLANYAAQKPEDEVIKALDTIGDYEKTLSAFVSRLQEADPVIRTEYNAIVSSGRTSARTSTAYPSVNIQQMPRALDGVTWDVRNCFIPREGYLFCSIDYNGLELSATGNQLKKVFGKSAMWDVLNSGIEPVDMHSKFAARLKSMHEKKQVTYEEFVLNKKKPGYKEFRQLAKPINLGFPGGIGYDTMRTLLAREGIYPKYQVLYKTKHEKQVESLFKEYRKQGHPVRVKRTKRFEWALVYDELVTLKQELFSLYPDLKQFLTEEHTLFLTGDKKAIKNEFGEWETEEMYAFDINGVRRNWCTYTAFCNGYMMQSPAAIGAKRAMRSLIRRYLDDDRVNILGFIHDEVIFEIKDCPEKYDLIQDISHVMIKEMQTVLNTRIAVEAELFPYWKKAGGIWDKTYWIDHNSTELKSLWLNVL